jgi:supervillin
VRLQRKAISSRNPLKALAARTDLQDEYIEVRSGIAEKEVKRLKVEKCEYLAGSLLSSISV